jgi:hypothetical protein
VPPISAETLTFGSLPPRFRAREGDGVRRPRAKTDRCDTQKISSCVLSVHTSSMDIIVKIAAKHEVRGHFLIVVTAFGSFSSVDSQSSHWAIGST